MIACTNRHRARERATVQNTIYIRLSFIRYATTGDAIQSRRLPWKICAHKTNERVWTKEHASVFRENEWSLRPMLPLARGCTAPPSPSLPSFFVLANLCSQRICLLRACLIIMYAHFRLSLWRHNLCYSALLLCSHATDGDTIKRVAARESFVWFGRSVGLTLCSILFVNRFNLILPQAQLINSLSLLFCAYLLDCVGGRLHWFLLWPTATVPHAGCCYFCWIFLLFFFFCYSWTDSMTRIMILHSTTTVLFENRDRECCDIFQLKWKTNMKRIANWKLFEAEFSRDNLS